MQKHIEKWIILTVLSLWTGDLLGQWLTGYSHRNKIEILTNGVSGTQDLVDFALLVSMSGPELRTAAYGGEVMDPSGRDIRFTLENGTLLDFDMEFYSIATGNLVAWVHIPILSNAENFIIYVYYGNPSVDTYPPSSNVWTSDYRGVWHMSFNTMDASQHMNHGNDKGTTSMDGKIGLSRGFDGLEDKVDVPYNPSLGIQDNLTIETWLRYTDTNDFYNGLVTKQGDYELWYQKDHLVFIVAGGSIEYPVVLEEDRWYHICATYDRSDLRLYMNGSEVSSLPNSTQISDDVSAGVGLGFHDGQVTSELSGDLDEVRISSRAFSKDWIRTTYINQHDPAAFSSYIGTEIKNDLPCDATVINANDSCDANIFSNTGASDSGIPMTTCDGYSGGDVWFNIEVPTTGNMIVKIESGSTPAIPTDGDWLSRPGLAVYSGSCNNLTYDTCWIGPSSGAPFLMPDISLTGYTPGDTLFLRVWGYTNSIGKFSICALTDDENPVINCPGDMEGQTDQGNCSASVVVPIPITSDDKGIASLVNNYNGTDNASDTYPAGLTVIKWTVTDLTGNQATCTHSILVTDTVGPQITCPDDQEVYLTNQCEFVIPDYTDSVDVNDNCDPAPLLSQTPIAGTKISGVGTIQQIILNANDTSNNISQCQFDITLLDTINPSASNPVPINLQCAGELPAPDITVIADEADNCTTSPVVTFVSDVEEGSCPIIITRTYSVTDISRNNINVTQTITVDDNTDPTFDTNPGNLTALCDISEQPAYADLAAFVTAGGSVSDNCGIDTTSFSLQSEISSGTGNPLTTTRTYLIADLCGNTATYVQDIVFTDTQDPTIACSADILQSVDPGTCNATVVVPLPLAGDNCGIDSVTNDFNGLANASGVYPVGTSSVTWTATDLNGNTAICNQNIIITDNEAPEIICPETITEYLDENCEFMLPDYTISTSINDNCDATPLITQSPAMATILSGSGTVQEIVLTVSDEAGNESTCTFNITLLDNMPPEASSINDTSVTVQKGIFETYIEILLPVFTDNCGVQSVTNDFNGGTDASGIYQYGTTTVVYTVIDFSNNVATFDQKVAVGLENEPENGLVIPEAFSPNDDGLNDRFEILGLEQYSENELQVYNVHGIEVFRMTDYDNSWDGTAKGKLDDGNKLPTGTYYYVLRLVPGDKLIKGFVYLRRE